MCFFIRNVRFLQSNMSYCMLACQRNTFLLRVFRVIPHVYTKEGSVGSAVWLLPEIGIMRRMIREDHDWGLIDMQTAFDAAAKRWWLVIPFVLLTTAGLLELDIAHWVFSQINSATLTVLMSLVFGFGGYKLLELGSDATVDEATAFAEKREMGDGVVATILAFGTSLAELGFVVISLIKGEPTALFGAIVGSDGFNIGVVFALSVIAAGSSRFVENGLKQPMIVLAIMTAFVGLAAYAGFAFWLWPVLILITSLLAAWLFLRIKPEKKDGDKADARSPEQNTANGEPPMKDGEADGESPDVDEPFSLSRLLLGFASLLLGTLWLFSSIVAIAALLGVPPLVIGLIGAIITSLPEIMVTVPMVAKGKMTLVVAAVTVAASNAFDTAFMALPATIGNLIGSPLEVGTGAGVQLAALVTMAVTLWLLVSALWERISRFQAIFVLMGFMAFLVFTGIAH